MTDSKHYCVSGQLGCDYRPDQVFECDQCHKEVCYCQGCDDEHPESCADCVFPSVKGSDARKKAKANA
jgi:hypothetical protein